MSRLWWLILIAVVIGALVAGSYLMRPYLEQQGVVKENLVDEAK